MKKVIILLLSCICLFANISAKTDVASKIANDISFVDSITINDREFDELPSEIEFYSDDLQDGKVIVQGILESEDESTSVESLHVEITTDGGNTWSRATGHSEWEWSFSPELEYGYEFSLRVVQDTYNDTINLDDSITIAGFKLRLNVDVALNDGKISGSGKIEIPYLKKIAGIQNEIDVDFSNLSVVNNIVTIGDITYAKPFSIDTPLASLNVDSIVFSPTLENNKIVGSVDFKDTLGASFGEIDLPSSSKFLPTSFALNIPFESKVIDIWKEKSVAIAISEGSLDIGYNLGDELPSVDLNIPSAQFKMGDLLRYANGLPAEVGLGDFGKTPSVTLPNDVFLLDTGIKIPSGLNLGFDLNDYANPKLTFNSSVTLDDFTNDFAKNLQNATISVSVEKTGFEATLTGDGGLDAVTLLNRGSDEKSVKLLFEGDKPSFTFGINNSDNPLSFSLSGITPKLQFGELFTNEAGATLNKTVSLGSIKAPSFNINEPIYLLGSKIKLPSGFSASVDLSDIKAPVLDFDIGVDFKEFDNIIAKQISGAKIKGKLSKAGFNATVTANKPEPIDIYTPKDVKIVFTGESGPSFGINITGTESLPEFSISNIEADLDFGTLLTSSDANMQKVIARVGVIREDGLESLQLTLPANVRLLQSKLKFNNIVSNLDLKTKKISIDSSVDLSEYTQNPVLKALNGADFDMSITPESFSGSIALDDELDPIAIWAEKNVNLTISGKPTIGVSVDSGGLDFDFGELNAAIDFGELLKTAKNSATSVVATFGQALNDTGNYSVKIQDDVYLLGSSFALKGPQIDFNPNIKSITIGSGVNLTNYTQPMIKAFDGAIITASIASDGFSGTLTKEGGFEPIVVLERGGVGKDVSVEFTSSPVIGVKIKNSGLDFDFSGGSADLHFGDLLGSTTASLRSLKDGIYGWEINGKKKLFSSAKAYIEEIKNAKLDIKDFSNPKVYFDAKVDLSEYGGLLKSVKSANLKNVEISKSGFSASLSASLGSVDIWKEKRVTMSFLSDPTISLAINKSGLDVGFSNIAAKLNFGDLLGDASATLGNVMQSGDSSLVGFSQGLKGAKNSVKNEVASIVESNDFSWNIDRNNIPLFDSNILMSGLGGSIDLSDISNPSITLNATANLSGYGSVFKYVRTAEVQNVTISKEGFSGSLITSIEDIPIWKEKNVKVHFKSSPKLYLKVNASGVKVGASSLDASVDMGSLLNNSTANLRSLQNDVYSWDIDAKNKLADTSVYLSKLKGKIDFSNLKDPVLAIQSAKVDGFTSQFQSVSLKNAEISKEGFEAYLSAQIDDINLYTEETKKVDLKFKDGKTPTLHLKITRSDTQIGLSELSASLAFTNILNDSALDLIDTDVGCSYDWGLSGTHDFINNPTNGVVSVSNIGGKLNLCDWSNPKVNFHTVADFTNFNFSDNLNLGIADVTNAEITKTSINWNVTLQNARANFTILDMGTGENDDVRVELSNINASAGNGGASVDGADGTLFFGKLFNGNKQIGLTYQTSDGGLKTYGFKFSEDVVYKKDDNNFVTLKSPQGELVEIANDTYKVVIRSQVTARSSVLSAISIGELTATDLEIGSEGFKGDLTATFENVSKNILEGKASVVLRSVKLHVNSKLDVPISLKAFDGDLDLQYFFDENAAKATLSFVNGTSSLAWNFPAATTLHVNQNFEFKNLSGTLNLASLDELSIGLSGDFGYKDINQNMTLTGFTVGSEGLAGTVNWNGTANIITNLNLKSLGVTFAGVDTQGSVGLKYNDASFLSTGKTLDLGLSATISQSGIDKFEVDSDLASITIPNFAIFKFDTIEASTELKDFWISLDGSVKPNHDVFSSEVGLEFEKLKISSAGVSVGSMQASANISGANADLGAISIGVTELGLGFDEAKKLFYISAHGGLSLDIIGDANAGIKIYSDKTLSVDDIGVHIRQSGLSADGNITWYDRDGVYGDGFKATLGLGIAKIFTADGLFRIGKVDGMLYWMANANGGIGGGVPFGALTMYEAGGGIGYNMLYNKDSKDFVPKSGALSLMLNTTLGTSGDDGYLWNGKISLKAGIVNNVLQQINLDGDSWLLADRGSNPSDRYISANMTYAKSPSMLHVWVNANVKYKGIKVKGSMDAIISDAEKHVFIGTDSEYAYAFNVDKDLGHVTVGIFGIEGRGFFMVDTNAIAFGESLYLYKHWSKSWWGPDPSLTFKLTAGAKALLIYNPFQMNMDIFSEVSLKGCYGGCVSIGADVLVKVALPNPDYIWGKAGVRIFGTSMTFKGFIRNPNGYTSSDLQPATEAPDLEILDRVEVPNYNGMASRIPLIKIYSKMQHSQNAISIELKDIKLKKNRSQVEIPLKEYTLEGDFKGSSYMPQNILDRDTVYVLSGKMKGTYMEDGKSEVQEKEIYEIFRTTSSDDVAFSDIVKSITPSNGDKNVHEDQGVKVAYNQKAIDVLGGTSAREVQAYRIYLNDADGNNIVGHFSEPDDKLEAKFNPTKDLRIYRYCKNEEGDIRETFTLNGVYLNPFNDFSEDDGMEELPTQNGGTTGVTALNREISDANHNVVIDGGHDIQTILLAAQNSSSEHGSITTVGGIKATSQQIELIKAIPVDLRIGNLTLKKPAEALGEEIISTFSRGKSYTYYRASTYKVKVVKRSTGQVVYASSFDIRYNNIPAETKRKVEQMNGNLEPTLSISLDMMRIGANSTYSSNRNANTGQRTRVNQNMNMSPTAEANRRNNLAGGSTYNGGFYNEVRYKIEDSLADIGVYSGVKRKVFVTWELQKSDGSLEDVREELSSLRHESKKLLPGIVRGYKDASIQFFLESDNSFLVEVPMDLITGDTFCTTCEQEAQRENQERLKEISKKVKDSNGLRAGVVINDVSVGVVELDGGFSHVGGTFNPMQEGDFDIMGDNISIHGSNRNFGSGNFNGTQGVNINIQNVGR